MIAERLIEKAGKQPVSGELAQHPTGAEVLVEALCFEGVDAIFGYPGGAVLHIYDELWRARERITHYLVRHEQGAVHMAEGYARATGRVGVVLVTSGPGATNAVTGIANAYMDSTPIVVITGQVPRHLIGTDAFQEVDTVGITRPCVKHNYLVRDVHDLGAVVREAFHLARTGRPGPVVIDIPKDVTAARASYSRLDHVSFPFTTSKQKPQQQLIADAVKTILNSRRPILYVGGGIVNSGAGESLRAFAEELQLPVAPTLMGLGGFESGHPLCLGMLGMHGTYAANMSVAESDLLIAVGVRFDDRVTGKLATFAPQASIIHVDIDPANIGKNVAPTLSIAGDAQAVLTEFLSFAKQVSPQVLDESLNARESWWKKIRAWQRSQPLRFSGSQNQIKPQAVIRELHQLTKGEAIITTDVGQHQMWVAQFYPFTRTRQLITSGGLGTMGFGLPAAVGAQLACPNELVIAIVGDGGFQMTNQELATAVQYSLPVKILIMNNGYLGMVRQWQEMFYDRTYSEVDISVAPDFVKLAEAYGAAGFRATHPDELHDVLKAALNHKGVAVIDIVVSKEENVFPIVPAGANANDMIVQNDGA
ncbi:MAG TPA: biosynthetic-type acetolactate synthase large subunit [Pyrinomonadaceae bacterium]|jgi:acetolactate synthase-1/2/3 large subunit|nr:biosynthetic-type acetolactate synthase large subunit [Pyrinomonadaceae bacterium]